MNEFEQVAVAVVTGVSLVLWCGYYAAEEFQLAIMWGVVFVVGLVTFTLRV